MASGDKVLVIDDDTTLLNLLQQSLGKAGYEVITSTNGLNGLQKMYEERPDLIILDVMMPRMDGWETCRRIREMSQVPIIMLTAKDEEAEKLKGFESGVDDYVTKPFSFAELTARVEAVLHRTRQRPPQHKPTVHHIDDLTINLENRRVTKNGEVLDLTPTEYRLLATLVENAGRVLSHEQLLSDVWGPEYVDDTGYVKRYIWYLRQKLEDDPSQPKYILTERGFGYRFRRD
ncbi:MAG: Transcriptional regulatory protein WalR [Anaerolineales bacterium]|nr:Transcriptional regulatory protein WalR [Anaerolineales bacterium]